jgi:hypothetical protein
MRRSGGHAALGDAIAAFQAEIQRLAFAAVRTIVEAEIARRQAQPGRTRPRKGRPAHHPGGQRDLGVNQAPRRQLELPLARFAAPDAARLADFPVETRAEGERSGELAPALATPTGEPQPSVPTGGTGRPRWTRETIISELATWLLSGTAIDAQFVTRHGPRGLVTAARRIFGRFDAALNLAALHNAKLYPDGPPARGVARGAPTAVAAASRHKHE